MAGATVAAAAAAIPMNSPPISKRMERTRVVSVANPSLVVWALSSDQRIYSATWDEGEWSSTLGSPKIK